MFFADENFSESFPGEANGKIRTVLRWHSAQVRGRLAAKRSIKNDAGLCPRLCDVQKKCLQSHCLQVIFQAERAENDTDEVYTYEIIQYNHIQTATIGTEIC